jgi:DNA replication ATP-dependent helicase Dna2
MFSSFNDINEGLNNCYVYGTSCLSIGNIIVQCVKFDYCFVIEAALINEPMTLGPIFLASKFVLVGDYFS